jgi:hypothetical protein
MLRDWAPIIIAALTVFFGPYWLKRVDQKWNDWKDKWKTQKEDVARQDASAIEILKVVMQEGTSTREKLDALQEKLHEDLRRENLELEKNVAMLKEALSQAMLVLNLIKVDAAPEEMIAKAITAIAKVNEVE